MTSFWIAATLLTIAAVSIIVVPLWRQRRVRGRWSVPGLAAALAIVPVAVGLYLQVTTWDPAASEREAEGERLVRQLAQQLEKTPDDVQGWRLLAHSYMALGQYAQSQQAYREVWKRTPDPSNDLKLSYAESLVLTDRSLLGGDAGRMIEEVLAEEPNNPEALWFGGFVALDGGRNDEARARWSRLLQMNPSDDLAGVLREQLAALGTVGTNAPSAPAVSGTRIAVKVRLGEGRSLEALPPQATLFIIARAPGAGPPVAVKRQAAAAVPGEFVLSDADAMIPGRSLADFDELAVVARISASGQPIEQPGDWYAQGRIRPKEGGTVELVIDQVVQ